MHTKKIREAEKNKIIGRLLIGLIIFCLFILSEAIVYLFVNSSYAFRQEILTNCHVGYNTQKNETVTTLVRLVNGSCVPLYRFVEKRATVYYDSYSKQWGNHIFFVNASQTTPSLFVVNMLTGMKKPLFSGPHIPSISALTPHALYFITNAWSQNNTQYTSTFYSIALSTKKPLTAKKLFVIGGGGGYMHQWGNTIYVVSVSNGPCATETYRVLNQKTAKLGKPVGTFASCAPGQLLISDSTKYGFLVASSRSSDPTQQITDPNYTAYAIYASLSLMPFANPSHQIPLLTSKNMPANITSVKYIRQENKVYLAGSTLYVYDLTTHHLSKLVNLPDTNKERYEVDYLSGNTVCMDRSSLPAFHGTPIAPLLYNTKTKQFIKRTIYDACYNDKPYNQDLAVPPITGTDMLRKLLLPTNYAVIVSHS